MSFHRLWAALAAAMLLLSACVTTSEAERAERGPLVTEVTIEGAEQVDAGDIKGKILTTETSWFAWLPNWLPAAISPPDHHFDPNAWQADLRRIERYYQAEGFYQAKVIDEQVTPEDGGVRARAVVQEGEPTRIRKLEISGLEDLSTDAREEVLDDLPLVEGDVFREENWAGVKDLIQQRLHEHGYAEAQVEGQVAVDVEAQTATVTIAVVPGLRYKFGNIYVAQDDRPKVPSRRIVEQARGAVDKGEWFSESDLAEAQARVFNMGVFGGVKVTRGAPDRDSGTVPVVVDVREAPFHSVRAGGGFGVDQARQEIRGLAEYTDRNFFGGLRRLNLRGRGGYAWLPNILEARDEGSNGPVFTLTGELEQPRFLFRDVSLRTSLEVEQSLEEAYQYLGARGRFGVVWRPHPDFSVIPSYGLEAYNITRSEGAGRFAFGEDAPLLVAAGCPTQPCRPVLSYLEQVVEWDRRDSIIEPTEGFYAAVSFQEGGGLLGGSFGYFRILPEVRGYTSFFDKTLTLAGKVRLGALLPSGGEESPVVARFFAGGANSMRGFSNRRLSPFVVSSDLAADANRVQLGPVGRLGTTEPIGGNSMLETSVELRYLLFSNLAVAVFYDAGTVRNDPTLAMLGELHHALGFGVRLLTPVGPIRLDLAARVAGPPLQLASNYTPEFSYRPDPTCFGFGNFGPNYPGSPEGLCSFHLSIGEAF